MTKDKKKQREAKKDRQQNFIYINCNKDNPNTTPDPKKLNDAIEYMNAKKRIIKFDHIESETINLMGNIICFKTVDFVDAFISILSTSQLPKNNDLNAEFLFQWMKEKDKNKIMYLKLDENDNVACFAILHKTDFDQYNTQKNPHVLDYIYTYKNYRNNKHAQTLINEIKKHYEFSAFCSNEISALTFAKCDIKLYNIKNGLILARNDIKF